MKRVLILAGTHREASVYARQQRLRPAEWKWPGRHTDIGGYERWTQIVELQGFHDRRDQHAVLAEVRRITRKYPKLEKLVVVENGDVARAEGEGMIPAEKYEKLTDEDPQADEQAVDLAWMLGVDES